MRKLLPFGLIFIVLFNSCVAYDSLLNYKEGDTQTDIPVSIINSPKLTIQSNDILDIKVHSMNAEAAAPFNIIPKSSLGMSNATTQSLRLHGYLVNQDGLVDFPVLGQLVVRGFTLDEVKWRIQEQLKTYLKDPVVNVRLLNFKVTVSGEVNKPGSFNVFDERITLPEAVTMAGDLTNYAARDSILIVREIDGCRSFTKVSMQTTDLFQSEYYYLQQNDLIYVEPQKAKIGSIRDQTNEVLPFISAAATLVAVVLSIIR